MTPRHFQMPSSKELDELKARVKILEQQRADDRERLKEMERLRQEHETAVAGRDKLQGSVKRCGVLTFYVNLLPHSSQAWRITV